MKISEKPIPDEDTSRPQTMNSNHYSSTRLISRKSLFKYYHDENCEGMAEIGNNSNGRLEDKKEETKGE
jgi:hypothetical protein